MIKRILLCILAGISATALAAPPSTGETSARKTDERLLLKRLPAPEKKKDAGTRNPFKAPVRVNPLKTPLSNSQFYGTILASSEWSEYYMNGIKPPYGVYSFPKEVDDTASPEMTDPLFANVVSGFYRENTYAVMTQTYSEDYSRLYNAYYEFDTDSWKMIRNIEINDPTYIAPDMAYNPADGLVYGSFYNNRINGFNFASFNPVTLDYNMIAAIPDQMRYLAITADNNGHIYAINNIGDFLSVDPSTGVETTIGPSGITPSAYIQSMTWDAVSGKIYWVAVLNGAGSLYMIDELTYIITDPTGSILVEGVTATEWHDTAEMDGKMATHIYNVAAVYDGKTGEAGTSEGVVTGTPHSTPFHESFAKGKYQNDGWWGTYDTDAGGHIYQFIPLHNNSADADGEAMAFEAWNYFDSPDGVNATLNSGKISLKDVENPSLIFWYYGYVDDSDLTLEVYINDCGKSTQKVWETVINSEESMDSYRRVEIPLNQYAGHDYIYVSFRGNNRDSYWAGMYIDNVWVRDV